MRLLYSTMRRLNARRLSRIYRRTLRALSASSNIKPREMRGIGVLERQASCSSTSMRGAVSKQLVERICPTASAGSQGMTVMVTDIDILSYNGKGDEANQKLWLEIKTTNGPRATPFYITNNELRVSEERPDIFRIIRLYNFRQQVRAFVLIPPLERHVFLSPTIYRASF